MFNVQTRKLMLFCERSAFTQFHSHVDGALTLSVLHNEHTAAQQRKIRVKE